MSDQGSSGDSAPNVPFSEQQLQALMNEVQLFVEKLEEVGHENMQDSVKDYEQEVILAHRLAMGSARGMLKRFEKKPATMAPDKAENLTYRLMLAISFLQGVHHCYEAIGKGLYVQARALLRQEMETIAGLATVRKHAKVTTKGQDVGGGNIAWMMNRQHGDLSSATHLSDSAMLDRLYRSDASEGDQVIGRPVRLMPIYSKVDSVNLFAFQAGLLIQLCDEIHSLLMELYGEGANALEMYSRHAAFEYLCRANFLVEKK